MKCILKCALIVKVVFNERQQDFLGQQTLQYNAPGAIKGFLVAKQLQCKTKCCRQKVKLLQLLLNWHNSWMKKNNFRIYSTWFHFTSNIWIFVHLSNTHFVIFIFNMSISYAKIALALQCHFCFSNVLDNKFGCLLNPINCLLAEWAKKKFEKD